MEQDENLAGFFSCFLLVRLIVVGEKFVGA